MTVQNFLKDSKNDVLEKTDIIGLGIIVPAVLVSVFLICGIGCGVATVYSAIEWIYMWWAHGGNNDSTDGIGDLDKTINEIEQFDKKAKEFLKTTKSILIKKRCNKHSKNSYKMSKVHYIVHSLHEEIMNLLEKIGDTAA